MKKLKGVAVGAGYFSQFHYEAWSRLEGVELSAICDVNRQAAQSAADQHGVPSVYVDFTEMLEAEKPDFVDLITRPDSHLELTKAAVERGVAVICQKPLAPTMDECRELVAAAQNAGVPLMVHENFRFQPWYREIRKLIDEGVIGDRLHAISTQTRTGDGWQEDAYMARQPYFRTMPKFLIFETGVHFIDTFRFLGGEIDGVYASLRTLNQAIAGEDSGTVVFEFQSGAQGLWDANRYNESNAKNPRYTFGQTLVEGSGGSIRLLTDGRLLIQRLGQSEQPHHYNPSAANFAGDCVFATQQHFIACLLNDQPFETSGSEYLKTLQVQEAVYQSAQARTPVRNLLAQESSHADH
ncbi:putative oxidoreductase YcjS [Stieleria bergensis]|uniref:Putative oxidoreductase YcjS n=1 Tax=Stieleria bergensis TaxID=2528025 RepID=A0A517T2U8_9BACT|nr:putative oxidoreductase YcjS [Planctomycetes bacterium SV_7m_r]